MTTSGLDTHYWNFVGQPQFGPMMEIDVFG